jgi:hypothetical protein
LEDSLRKALLEIGRLKGEVKYLRVENGQLRAENQAIRFAPAPAPPVKPEHDFEQHHVQVGLGASCQEIFKKAN